MGPSLASWLPLGGGPSESGPESRLCSLPWQNGRVRPSAAWAWCAEAQRPGLSEDQAWPCDHGAQGHWW